MTGKQIANMRMLYGYSLRELGSKAHVSHTEIQYIEQGLRPLSIEIEEKIVNAMYQLSMEAAKKRADRQRRQAAKMAKMEERDDVEQEQAAD